LILGPNTQALSGFMHILTINRYLGDRSEALEWAREMLAKTNDSATNGSHIPKT